MSKKLHWESAEPFGRILLRGDDVLGSVWFMDKNGERRWFASHKGITTPHPTLETAKSWVERREEVRAWRRP